MDYAYLKTVPQLNKYYEELKDWDWVFGRTPQFNHQFETRFPWGGVEVHLNSNKGIIEETKIFSDSLFPPLIEAFMNTLTKSAYDGSVILGKLNSLKKNYPDHQGEISDFSSWLIANIK
jgi:lipoate-protein ligase A